MARRWLSEGEQVLLTLHTHVKVLLLPAAVLVATCGVAGYLLALGSGRGTDDYVRLAVLGTAGAVILVFCLVPYLRWRSTVVTVTDRRLLVEGGLLRRWSRAVPLAQVANVTHSRSVTDRLLGCGTLVVYAAGQSAGLELPDLPAVKEVHRTLSRLAPRQAWRNT